MKVNKMVEDYPIISTKELDQMSISDLRDHYLVLQEYMKRPKDENIPETRGDY